MHCLVNALYVKCTASVHMDLILLFKEIVIAQNSDEIKVLKYSIVV